jgi:hypothetical protein
VGGIRQTEIQTADPFVPEPSISEVEVAFGKLKSHKSPGADQLPAVPLQAEGAATLHSEIHKLVKLIWNKEELPHQWKESIVIPIHNCQLHTMLVVRTTFLNLASVSLKMSSHLIRFIKKLCTKSCAFNAICKDNTEINLQYSSKQNLIPVNFKVSYYCSLRYKSTF